MYASMILSSPKMMLNEPVQLQRKPPKRKHLYTWHCTDSVQLQRTERMILRRLSYDQATIAGLNTISNEKILSLADEATSALQTTPKFPMMGVSQASSEESFISRHVVTPYGHNDVVSEKEIMVLVHGFGGGVACWAQNWDFFSQRYRLYAIDLPGFARSERIERDINTLQESMDFICGYLDRWFARMQFEKPVILLGHSFGCFVCSHYAFRAGPSRVRVLALADPWGVNEADPEWEKNASLATRIATLMFYNISPLCLIRGTGPVGPGLLRRLCPKFADNWKSYLETPKIFYDYMYHCNAKSPPVGEILFRACCHHNVSAKEPLRVALPNCLNKDIPVCITYGVHSWLPNQVTLDMASTMEERGFIVRTGMIEDAGHHLMMDNVESFNSTMNGLLMEVLK